jgi:hypothetical protein
LSGNMAYNISPAPSHSVASGSQISFKTNSEVIMDDEFTQLLKKKEFTPSSVNKYF